MLPPVPERQGDNQQESHAPGRNAGAVCADEIIRREPVHVGGQQERLRVERHGGHAQDVHRGRQRQRRRRQGRDEGGVVRQRPFDHPQPQGESQRREAAGCHGQHRVEARCRRRSGVLRNDGFFFPAALTPPRVEDEQRPRPGRRGPRHGRRPVAQVICRHHERGTRRHHRRPQRQAFLPGPRMAEEHDALRRQHEAELPSAEVGEEPDGHQQDALEEVGPFGPGVHARPDPAAGLRQPTKHEPEAQRPLPEMPGVGVLQDPGRQQEERAVVQRGETRPPTRRPRRHPRREDRPREQQPVDRQKHALGPEPLRRCRHLCRPGPRLVGVVVTPEPIAAERCEKARVRKQPPQVPAQQVNGGHREQQVGEQGEGGDLIDGRRIVGEQDRERGEHFRRAPVRQPDHECRPGDQQRAVEQRALQHEEVRVPVRRVGDVIDRRQPAREHDAGEVEHARRA